MAAEPPRREHKPLVERVDALLRRHQAAQRLAEAEVPLLTEIVEAAPGGVPSLDAAALEALAVALEQAVLERLAPDIERAIETHLRRALHAALDDATKGLRDALSASVQSLSREAVADALARALGHRAPAAAGEASPSAGHTEPPPASAQR